MNAGIGTQGIVGELKLTNKQFRILNSYCEEKKQCAHVEVFSKASTDDATHFNHELEINIDLRKLGLSHEFGLKAVTNRKFEEFYIRSTHKFVLRILIGCVLIIPHEF